MVTQSEPNYGISRTSDHWRRPLAVAAPGKSAHWRIPFVVKTPAVSPQALPARADLLPFIASS